MKKLVVVGLCGNLVLGQPLYVQSQQCCNPCAPVESYRLQTETVYEEVPQTVYRTVYENITEEREEVRYRPVTSERVEQRTRTVRKPVKETSVVNQTYTIYKPVERTEMVDKPYYEESYVDETVQKEQITTVYKPVTETEYRTQNVVVQKPVTETVYQTQSVTVQKPVTETVYQTQNVTIQRPVTETTYQTQNYVVQRPVNETVLQTQNYTAYQPVVTQQLATVDTGGYVAQQQLVPGDTTYRLRWQPGGYNLNESTGQTSYRRAGLGWTPYQSAPQAYSQLQYQSNYQTVAIPQTSYVPQVLQQQVPVQTTRLQSEVVQQQVPVQSMKLQTEVVQQQVPVQVTRMENQVVQQQVPVQATRMQEEVVQQQVPVSVQKMQAYQQTTIVPETTRKKVSRLVENKVEKKVVDWVAEQVVRPVTTTRETFKLETVTEDVPVKIQSMERYVEKVPVTRRVARQVAETRYIKVPRRVTTRIPMGFYDPYGASSSLNYSTFENLANSERTSEGVVTAGSNASSPSDVRSAEYSTVESPSKSSPYRVEKVEIDPQPSKVEHSTNRLSSRPGIGSVLQRTGDEQLPAKNSDSQLSLPD